MTRHSRDKGARREREIVKRHTDLGVRAEKVSAMYRPGPDVDIYARGAEDAPFITEVKGRANGEGFKTLERWLGDNDALFLVRDRADPVVVLPWEIYVELLGLAGVVRPDA